MKPAHGRHHSRHHSRHQSNRTASQQYLRAALVPSGSRIWSEDAELGWCMAEVLEQDNTLLRIRKIGSSQITEIDLGFKEMFQTNPAVVPDMTSLYFVHEPGLLHNLKERSHISDLKPYTYMGTVLIAVNPLVRIPEPSIRDFVDIPLQSDNPHPFAIAELAFQQMRVGIAARTKDSTNQSIVISGESGAGKTETAKIVLRYLSQRSDISSGTSSSTQLDRKLVQSSPILEAFGNAKTLRNANSSRFGKFMIMQFSEQCVLAGGMIDTYLLEKSRVVTQIEGERNYHVFYQLLAARECATYLPAAAPETFRILNAGSCVSVPGVNDANIFGSTLESMRTCGIDDAEIADIWRLLAGILQLGNVLIGNQETGEGSVSVILNPEHLSWVSEILGVQVNDIEKVLTERQITTRGETYNIRLLKQDAEYCCDAMLKAMYESIFHHLVTRINQSLGKAGDDLPFIGVLDIFGFESFPRNDFEQLLINYANETLQNTFNQQVFNAELQLYKQEDIECNVSSAPDNLECVQLIVGRPDGILVTLDNIARQPKPSDTAFCAKLHEVHARHTFFPQVHPKDRKENFMVKHFAGKVKYTVGAWIVKNNDSVPDGMKPLLAGSSLPLLQTMFSTIPSESPTKGSTFTKPTISSIFNKSMHELSNTLQQTRASFVRCIKPNPAMQPGLFDNLYVIEQLRSLGILQTCEVLKIGLPTRVTYKQLRDSLAGLAASAEALFANEPEQVFISCILWAFEVPDDVYRLGRTKVFFKSGQISRLESILTLNMETNGPQILTRLEMALNAREEAKKLAADTIASVERAEAMIREARSIMEVVQAENRAATAGISMAAMNRAFSAADEFCEQLAKKEEAVAKAVEGALPAKSEAAALSTAQEAEAALVALRAMIDQATISQQEMHAAEGLACEQSPESTAIASWDIMEHMEKLLKDVQTSAKQAEDAAARCKLPMAEAAADLVQQNMRTMEQDLANLSASVQDIRTASTNSKSSWEKARQLAEDISSMTDYAQSLHDTALSKCTEALHIAENERMNRLEEAERERIRKEREKKAKEDAERRAREEEAARIKEEQRRQEEEQNRRRERDLMAAKRMSVSVRKMDISSVMGQLNEIRSHAAEPAAPTAPQPEPVQMSPSTLSPTMSQKAIQNAGLDVVPEESEAEEKEVGLDGFGRQTLPSGWEEYF